MPVPSCLAAARVAPLLLAAALAGAQPAPPPSNVVHLSAQASVEVPRDLLTVVFATTREGPDAAVVQSQLKQALETALTEARLATRPGALEPRTGNFSLRPRYAPRGGTDGWTGTTELIVEGRDTQAIAELSGRLRTLTIASVAYSLSREAREKLDGEMLAQAIIRFRAKAAAVAGHFGFTGYLLRDVQVGDSGPGGPVPVARTRMAAALSEDALPVEAGKETVTVAVSGSVQLTK